MALPFFTEERRLQRKTFFYFYFCLFIMGPANCAVIGCTNSTYKLKKWLENICDIHHHVLQKNCSCEPPYRLYTFPSNNRYKHQRERWVKMIRRQGPNNTVWQPCTSDRVCSEHFVDKFPTEAHPDPTFKTELRFANNSAS